MIFYLRVDDLGERVRKFTHNASRDAKIDFNKNGFLVSVSQILFWVLVVVAILKMKINKKL